MISFIKYFSLLVLLLAALAAGAFFYISDRIRSIDESALRKGTQIYTVAHGATPLSVAMDLSEAGEDRLFYRLWFKLNPEYTSLKAGTYSLEKARNLRDAFAIICEGRELSYYFPVIEGTRFEQITARMKQDPNIAYDLDEADLESIFTFNPENPEGQLYAESYRYTVGDRASDILKRSFVDLEKYLNLSWEDRAADLPLKNPYEALILASIVEKETASRAEYPLVAAVFINRLNRHMKLQSDPTTIYGIKDRYDGNIRKRDLQDVNEYNTYVIDGLPPTPIAVASKPAIEAVLHPADVDYLYFVADGTGGHRFSRTLSEHNRAVADYVKLQRERKKASVQQTEQIQRKSQDGSADGDKNSAAGDGDVQDPGPASEAVKIEGPDRSGSKKHASANSRRNSSGRNRSGRRHGRN